jgi:hypothetical protein
MTEILFVAWVVVAPFVLLIAGGLLFVFASPALGACMHAERTRRPRDHRFETWQEGAACKSCGHVSTFDREDGGFVVGALNAATVPHFDHPICPSCGRRKWEHQIGRWVAAGSEWRWERLPEGA